MREYLVEVYFARGSRGGMRNAVKHARKAAESLAAEGARIRYVRSIYLPADETCFHIYEALDVDCVEEASRRAGAAVTRVVEAL